MCEGSFIESLHCWANDRVEMSPQQFIEFHEFLCVQFGWLRRGSVGLSSKVKHSVLASPGRGNVGALFWHVPG